MQVELTEATVTVILKVTLPELYNLIDAMKMSREEIGVSLYHNLRDALGNLCR